MILPYSDRLDHYKIASFGATSAPEIDITNLISKSKKKVLKNENRSVQKVSQAFLHGSLLAGIDGLGLDLTQKSSKSD